ncbi:unnamed protein product [Meloidogyne enterolobii]|uniref:Uncharacterized protein n=1 Tax=Meloidogyne enterolobii TaxID=390850 RepID=A0ACB1ABJ9_MELEN
MLLYIVDPQFKEPLIIRYSSSALSKIMVRLYIIYQFKGFFCNDNEIRFPYVPDTVSAGFMDWTTNIVGTIIIISSEFSLVWHLIRRHTDKRLHRRNGHLHPMIVNSLYFLGK